METRRVAVPLAVFVASRIVVWVGAIAAYVLLDPTDAITPAVRDLGWGIDLWAQWDADWYLQIAEHGYDNDPRLPAFHPLYPGLVAVLGRLLGGHFVAAAVVVSIVSAGAACVLLYRLALRHLDEPGALRTIVLVAIFPTTLFLGAVYSEGLFLALAVGGFLLAERGRPAGAGAVAGLAILTRTAGIALIPALAILAWRDGGPRAAARMALPAVAIAAIWPIYLWVELGNPFAFLDGQDAWGRELTALGPLAGVGVGALAAVLGAVWLATGTNLVSWWPQYDEQAIFAVLQFSLLIALMVLTATAWRRFGAAYGVFAVGTLVVPLSSPILNFPLGSLPRFAITCFPCFMALAWVARRPWALRVTLLVFAVGLILAVGRWSGGVWVS